MTTHQIIDRLAHMADPSGAFAAYLASGSYYTDPASVHRHRCYPGGLADHSLGVLVCLRRLAAGYTVSGAIEGGVAPALTFIALAHDLCKVGTYQQTAKSQKRKGEDGRYLTDYRGKPVWEDVLGYEYIPPAFPLGHGDSSAWRLLEACPALIGRPGWEAVILAIRWHMGAYQCSSGEEMQRMGDACARSPLVILTQTADMLDTYHGIPQADLPGVAEHELRDLLGGAA